MKPSIPDTGTVIGLEGGNAVVRLKHEGSCRNCGAAAMGLCKGGLQDVLTVRNAMRARVGDTVRIGLVPQVQYAGYFLAYVVPPLAFVLGAVAGHFLGNALGVPPLDIIGGFLLMAAASLVSFRRLKRLDSSHAIEIVHVLSDPWRPAPPRCGDGPLTSQIIHQAGPFQYR